LHKTACSVKATDSRPIRIPPSGQHEGYSGGVFAGFKPFLAECRERASTDARRDRPQTRTAHLAGMFLIQGKPPMRPYCSLQTASAALNREVQLTGHHSYLHGEVPARYGRSIGFEEHVHWIAGTIATPISLIRGPTGY